MMQADNKTGLLGRIINRLLPATITASAGASQTHRPAQLDTQSTQAATSLRSGRRHDIQARLDSQFTTPLNAAHFALMDAMSVDAMASWMVRRKIRMMCRYEYHNNPLFMGVVDTYADYVIGTGPKLQILTKNRKFNDTVERIYAEWSEEVAMSDRLHGSCAATNYNGEGFLLLRHNPGLESPIKLDLFDVEADQVSSPLFGMYPAEYPDQYFDGVVLDPWGRPRIYHVLRQHPGAFGAFVILGYVFDPWPAANVIHDYRRIRPGQQRGLPNLLPCLPNFANLRRLGLATVLNAENAAKWGITVETPALAEPQPLEGVTNPDGSPVYPTDLMDANWEMEYGMMNRLPAGTKANMLHPEQPGANYDTLVNIELGAIGRSIGMPMFIVSLDARQANMSSAYVAMQPFGKRIRSERKRYNRLLNTRIWPQFIRELALMNMVSGFPDDAAKVPHAWTWDRVNDHADPGKVAVAAQMRIDAGITSRRQEAADLSLDMDEQDEMAAADYGVSLEEYRDGLFQGMLTRRGNVAPVAALPNLPQGKKPAGGKNVEDEEID